MGKKKNTNHPPRFVNLAMSVVTVFDETKRNVRVAPWHRRDRSPAGIFVVEGAHYQQFVSGRGPLHPFPAGEALPVSGVVDSFGKRLEAQSEKALDVGAIPPSPKAPTTPDAPADQGGDVDNTKDEETEGGADGGEGQDGDDAGAGGEDTGDGDPDGADDPDTGGDDDEVTPKEVNDDPAPPKETPKRSLADRMLGRNKAKTTTKKPAKKKASKKSAKKKKKGG